MPDILDTDIWYKSQLRPPLMVSHYYWNYSTYSWYNRNSLPNKIVLTLAFVCPGKKIIILAILPNKLNQDLEREMIWKLR